ncbi:MAG: zinc ribbon domain-containing protein [Phycisphaeraceae bacterium]|nr:zinc ribbon domain-containing protein [Phycisphaeraceae bacterium]
MSLKRAFLWCIIASASTAATLGVLVLLLNMRGQIVEQTLGTAFAVGLFSISALGAAFVLERRTWRPAMLIAVVIAVLGVLAWCFIIWMPRNIYWRNEVLDAVLKTGLICGFWTYALPQAGLLSLTSFPAGRYAIIRQAAILIALLMPALASIALVFDMDDGLSLRTLGIVGILDALGTLAVPVLYRIHGLEKDEGVQSTKLEIRLTCPRCQLEQTLPTGPGRCARCKLKIEVKIEEPRCPKCDYLLHHLTAPVCPECGAALSPEELPAEAPSVTQA